MCTLASRENAIVIAKNHKPAPLDLQSNGQQLQNPRILVRNHHSRPIFYKKLLTLFYFISLPSLSSTVNTNPRTEINNQQQTNVITVSHAQAYRETDRNEKDIMAPNKSFYLSKLCKIDVPAKETASVVKEDDVGDLAKLPALDALTVGVAEGCASAVKFAPAKKKKSAFVDRSLERQALGFEGVEALIRYLCCRRRINISEDAPAAEEESTSVKAAVTKEEATPGSSKQEPVQILGGGVSLTQRTVDALPKRRSAQRRLGVGEKHAAATTRTTSTRSK
ncbi:hypothetical protein M758_1G301400, partial [Ceratodon purpureus]